LENSHVDNFLVKIAPDLYQPFQFISALVVCMVNTLMNSCRYPSQKGKGMGCFGGKKNPAEVWLLSVQQFDSF